MRAGYIVQRHPFTWVVKNSESPTQIWNTPTSYNSRTNRLAQAVLSDPHTIQVNEEKDEEERAAKRQRTTVGAQAISEKTEVSKESGKTRWWSATTTATTNDSTSKNSWENFIDQSTLPRCIVREPAVHRALKLFPNMQPLHQLQPSEVVDLGIVNKDGIGMLHFDVFAANSQFSRKVPGRPLYSVSVCGGGAPPSMLALNAADQASNGIPVRYSGIEHGDISYFAIARAELHKILT